MGGCATLGHFRVGSVSEGLFVLGSAREWRMGRESNRDNRRFNTVYAGIIQGRIWGKITRERKLLSDGIIANK